MQKVNVVKETKCLRQTEKRLTKEVPSNGIKCYYELRRDSND